MAERLEESSLPEGFYKTPIPDLLMIQMRRFDDERGSFQEVVRYPELEQATGVNMSKGQWNESTSHPGVIRAIHCENQYKLVRPVTGQVTLVFVDLRPQSPAFMDHMMVQVDADERRVAFFLPPGVGNAICVDGDQDVRYEYNVSSTYADTIVETVRWDDPDLNIDWPINEPIISERDRTAGSLREQFPEIDFDKLVGLAGQLEYHG